MQLTTNIICIAVIPATARVIQNKLFCQFVALDTSINFQEDGIFCRFASKIINKQN